jgi:hypothetical protein
MATLLSIREAIKKKLKDSGYNEPEIDAKINEALQAVAYGVLMPDGSISPPLPDLYDSDTVNTSTTLPYVSLPADYQRGLFYISDSTDMRIHPVHGGDYYSFGLFMNAAIKKDLSLPGTVLTACVKGEKLYYQGIPAASVALTIQFYRKPALLVAGTDEPEGLPEALALPILKHYVLKEEFGENIEDGEDSRGIGAGYHEKKFFEAMTTLIRSLPEDDSEPSYYGAGSSSRSDNW